MEAIKIGSVFKNFPVSNVFGLKFVAFLVHPGVKYREIGAVIQKYVQAHGYSVVKSYCGHGIHRLQLFC